MIMKNLVAHRESNKLTSIIYSLTLGCIIFVVVAANLQIKELSQYGGNENLDLSVRALPGNIMTASQIDPVIASYSYNIQQFAYSTQGLSDMYDLEWHWIWVSPIYDPTDWKYIMNLYGVSPSSLLDDSISIVYSN